MVPGLPPPSPVWDTALPSPPAFLKTTFLSFSDKITSQLSLEFGISPVVWEVLSVWVIPLIQ